MNDQELEKKIDDLLDRAIMRTQKKRLCIEGALLFCAVILILFQVI